ncbi:MAG: glycosyltransferase family 2 protein, partial [Nitrososphaeria archaeon]
MSRIADARVAALSAMDGVPPLLSVVIPTYNEAENVKPLLDRLRKSLQGISHELIFVDDNSPDGTGKILREQADPTIRVFVRQNERGWASAFVYGAERARGEYVVFMDADMQHPPEVLPEMLDAAAKQGADVVVASRYSEGGGSEGWSTLRLLVSKGATYLSRLLVPESWKTDDPMSGFFLFKRSSVDVSSLNRNNLKLLLEALCRNEKLKVVDVPYVFRPRVAGESKMNGLVVFSYVMNLLRISKPLKFSAALTSGVLISVGVMYSLMRLGLLYDLASAVGIEAAVLLAYAFRGIWGYRDRGKGFLSRLARYHVAVGPGALSMYLVMKAMVVFTGVYPPRGQVLAVLVGLGVYYVLLALGLWPPRANGILC